MIQLPADFQDFLRLLNDNGVKYLLVGGYAVGYYGFPRPTGDIDFWVGISSENAPNIVRVLKAFGFDLPELRDEQFLKEDQIIRLGNPPFRIEILTSVSGITFEEAYNKRQKVFFDGIPVDLLSLEDLKKNKAAANRDKDRIDLKNLP
ncbi:MAG: hypothetical protein WA705_25885 [Candidatus Ozemobacteraceae bacterium]